MPSFGVKLMSELRTPGELVQHAVEAEQRGLDFVAISDHIHPWLGDHEHSPAAWPVLGAVAAKTERIGIATGLTCPILRYHPVVIAQMAATVASMSGGRFTLAVGAGERLNEHVVGAGWPPVDVRHEMLGEAIEVMRSLWTGEFVSHRGRHFTAEDVRIYDLPDDEIPVVVGVSGPASLDLAARCDADGIMAIDADAALIDGWGERGGDRSMTYTEVAFAVAADEATGLTLAHRNFRFVSKFLEAGFDKVSFVPVGDDLERFWSITEQVVDRLATT